MQSIFGSLGSLATVLSHLKYIRYDAGTAAAAVRHGHLASRVRGSHFEAGNAML